MIASRLSADNASIGIGDDRPCRNALRLGPARGASRLKKVHDLTRIFSDVRAADRERNTVLARFPQLYSTICAANVLFQRELGKSHKSWVPTQEIYVHKGGNYSANGLDIIPRSN
jgi:hypothetical protein